MRTFRALLFLLAAAPALAASGAPPLVLAANPILADLVRQLAPPGAVRVRSLLAPGADPHDAEPRPADLRDLAAAALIVRNGLNLEPALDKLIRASGAAARVVTASDGLEPLAGDGGTPDPHAWLNPLNVIRYVENIRAALAALLPDQAGALAARAAACEEELRGLDRFARGRLADIPPRHRVLVTTHDSLAHLARAYGLRVLPLSGADGHAEPSARQVAAVINAIRADKIPAVFMDTTASPRLAALVARETGARLAPPLCADTLPEGGTYAETFRQNIRIIAGALRGDGG